MYLLYSAIGTTGRTVHGDFPFTSQHWSPSIIVTCLVYTHTTTASAIMQFTLLTIFSLATRLARYERAKTTKYHRVAINAFEVLAKLTFACSLACLTYTFFTPLAANNSKRFTFDTIQGSTFLALYHSPTTWFRRRIFLIEGYRISLLYCKCYRRE